MISFLRVAASSNAALYQMPSRFWKLCLGGVIAFLPPGFKSHERAEAMVGAPLTHRNANRPLSRIRFHTGSSRYWATDPRDAFVLNAKSYWHLLGITPQGSFLHEYLIRCTCGIDPCLPCTAQRNFAAKYLRENRP